MIGISGSLLLLMGLAQLGAGVYFMLTLPIFDLASNIWTGVMNGIGGAILLYFGCTGQSRRRSYVILILSVVTLVANVINIVIVQVGEYSIFLSEEDKEQLERDRTQTHFIIAIWLTTGSTAVSIGTSFFLAQYLLCVLVRGPRFKGRLAVVRRLTEEQDQRSGGNRFFPPSRLVSGKVDTDDCLPPIWWNMGTASWNGEQSAFGGGDGDSVNKLHEHTTSSRKSCKVKFKMNGVESCDALDNFENIEKFEVDNSIKGSANHHSACRQDNSVITDEISYKMHDLGDGGIEIDDGEPLIVSKSDVQYHGKHNFKTLDRISCFDGTRINKASVEQGLDNNSALNTKFETFRPSKLYGPNNLGKKRGVSCSDVHCKFNTLQVFDKKSDRVSENENGIPAFLKNYPDSWKFLLPGSASATLKNDKILSQFYKYHNNLGIRYKNFEDEAYGNSFPHIIAHDRLDRSVCQTSKKWPSSNNEPNSKLSIGNIESNDYKNSPVSKKEANGGTFSFEGNLKTEQKNFIYSDNCDIDKGSVTLDNINVCSINAGFVEDDPVGDVSFKLSKPQSDREHSEGQRFEEGAASSENDEVFTRGSDTGGSKTAEENIQNGSLMNKEGISSIESAHTESGVDNNSKKCTNLTAGGSETGRSDAQVLTITKESVDNDDSVFMEDMEASKLINKKTPRKKSSELSLFAFAEQLALPGIFEDYCDSQKNKLKCASRQEYSADKPQIFPELTKDLYSTVSIRPGPMSASDVINNRGGNDNCSLVLSHNSASQVGKGDDSFKYTGEAERMKIPPQINGTTNNLGGPETSDIVLKPHSSDADCSNENTNFMQDKSVKLRDNTGGANTSTFTRRISQIILEQSTRYRLSKTDRSDERDINLDGIQSESDKNNGDKILLPSRRTGFIEVTEAGDKSERVLGKKGKQLSLGDLIHKDIQKHEMFKRRMTNPGLRPSTVRRRMSSTRVKRPTEPPPDPPLKL